MSNYRPRTKYYGRSCFHRCLSVNSRGTPVCGTRSFPSLWSHILSGGHPSLWFHVLSGGYPGLWSHVLSGGTGTPLTDYTTGGMPLAVSRRRTFLFFTQLIYQNLKDNLKLVWTFWFSTFIFSHGYLTICYREGCARGLLPL